MDISRAVPSLLFWFFAALGGILMARTVQRILPAGHRWLRRAVPYVLFVIVIEIPSWIGDENPLILFPFFMAVFLLCYSGPWPARLVSGFVFYSLLVPLNMIIDSLVHTAMDLLGGTARCFIKLLLWALIALFVRRVASGRRGISLSMRLWSLIGGLALAPLVATLSFTFWNTRDFDAVVYKYAVNRIAYTILPFVTLSSLALLLALTVLAKHERLEREHQLAGMRELYYQSLKQEQTQVRMLRHDLRNHLTVVYSLLEQGGAAHALPYLDQLAQSPALTGGARLCENETANVVLASKQAAMEAEGLAADFEVELPQALPISDPDLCALLGNALDNAMESARRAAEKRVIVRARADKGIFMLRVENAVGHALKEENGGFSTTKADKAAHGFGLIGMREIALRYGGSLETRAEGGRFELVACFPVF